MLYTKKELELKLGQDIKTLRLLKNLARQTLCSQAGISMNSLRHLEGGDGATIKTLVAVLMTLDKIDWLLSIAPQISINPLHKIRGGKPRQRASKFNLRSIDKNEVLKHKKSLLKKYGLTADQYITMFNAQGGRCGNVGCEEKLDINCRKTHIDHDHTTGKIRSILCASCNSSLGFLKEDKNRIAGLIKYLDKHRRI